MTHPAGTRAEDQETIARVRAGDLNAFETLLTRYRAWVMAIVLRHVPPDRAGELAQTVFVEAYRGLPGYRGHAEFRHWLAGIAVRQCRGFWRREGRQPTSRPLGSLDGEARDWLERAWADAAREAFARETDRRAAREVLAWALDRLPADDRMLVTLLHLEERSVHETARLTGWSPVNVKVRAFRARQRLRRLIGQLVRQEETPHEDP